MDSFALPAEILISSGRSRRVFRSRPVFALAESPIWNDKQGLDTTKARVICQGLEHASIAISVERVCAVNFLPWLKQQRRERQSITRSATNG